MLYSFFLSLMAYLLGSVPYGLIAARLTSAPDPRTRGSGNIGATNVMRVMGAKLALVTLFCDTIKGSAAVLLAILMINLYPNHLNANSTAFCAVFAVIGHVFPIWLKFHGGKGVATALGVIIVLNMNIAALFIIVWIIVFILSRYVSLASITAIFIAGIAGCFSVNSYSIALLAIALIVIAKHYTNILRLIRGKEDKFVIGKKFSS